MSVPSAQGKWSIRFYTTGRGSSPALEYLNALSPKERAEADRSLALLQEFGVDVGLPHARPLRGKLWELRPGAHRLLYFAFVEQTFIILHAYHKQTGKAPEREIALALKRMAEYL